MSRSTTDPERLAFTISETARALGISRDAAYQAAARGELPTIRLGGRILVSRDALERLLSIEQRQGSEATA